MLVLGLTRTETLVLTIGGREVGTVALSAKGAQNHARVALDLLPEVQVTRRPVAAPVSLAPMRDRPRSNVAALARAFHRV